MKSKIFLVKPLHIAMASLFSTLPVSAQTVNDASSFDVMLEEIIVTAQRREQSTQDVPISISAFGAERIEQSDMKGAADYLQSTPNVSFTEVGGQGPKGLNISIRGISDLQNAERVSASSAFGVYVDEFSVGTAARGTPNPPLYDIERVEVLRGPQGTYFGRNSTGGAINVTTKKPDDKFYSQLDLGAGNFDTFDIGGVINVPVNERLFVRAAVQRESSGGIVENVNPGILGSGGGDSGYTNSNVRLAAHWDVSEEWSVDFSVNSISEDSDMENRVSMGIEGRFGSDITDSAFTCGLSTSTDDKACKDTTGFTNLKDDVYNLRIRYTGENVGFTSITGRARSTMNQLNDLDGGGTAWVDRMNSYEAESVSQEFRLFSTGGGAVDWTMGALTYKDELNAANQILIRDFLGPWMAGDLANENVIDLEREGYAAFADVVWHLNEQMTLTVGGRYSDDEESQVWSEVYGACPTRAEGDPLSDGCFLRPDQTGSLPVVNGRVSGGRAAQTDGTTANNGGSDFSPRIAFNWSLNDDVNVYSVASQGYKSAGARANPDSGGSNSSFYDKEKLTNLEFGFKAKFNGGRTRVDAAIFSMTWDDFQATLRETFCREDDGSLRPQNGNENCEFVPLDRIQNAKEASAKGFEISVDTLVRENWRFGVNYGYLDAKYEDFDNAILNNQTYDLSGQVLPNAPENTASASGEYRFGFGSADAYVRLEANYRDTVFNQGSLVDPSRAEFPFTPVAYTVFNLRAGLEWETQRLSFIVNNLTDEDDFVTSAASSTAGVTIRPHPTTYKLKWTVWTN